MLYWQQRTVETINPLAFFGRPWVQLTYMEQVQLMAYALLRMEEKAPTEEDDG